MEIYSVKNNHNQELLEIFNSFSMNDDIIKRGLVSQDNIVKNSILFIGINPSYKDHIDFKSPTNYYNLLQRDNSYKKYFGRFEDISIKTKTPWTHIDLFYFQHTDQRMLYHFLNHSEESKNFLRSQLAITKKILENVNPKVIVISNALARDFFGHNCEINLGYNCEFNSEIGTHLIKHKDSNLNDTPVFFTSMLTGVRALDNGSYERLIWHINKVLN